MENIERFYHAFVKFSWNIFQTVISILKIFFLSGNVKQFPEAQSDSISILANGPSLKSSLQKFSEYFKNTTCFCVNNFSSSEEYEVIKPSYYLFLDPAFFEYDEAKHEHPDIAAALRNLELKTKWPLNLFIPRKGKKSMYLKILQERNPNIHVYYINYTVVKGFTFFTHFSFKKNFGMPRCTNVLGGCIFLALNMGYKEIYFFGADHSWHEELRMTDDNTLLIKDFHFNDKSEDVKEHKLYESVERKQAIGIYRAFWWIYKTFQDYIYISEYAKKIDAEVYNASDKSYIDAFERKKPLVN
jgi:hypothetical protein